MKYLLLQLKFKGFHIFYQIWWNKKRIELEFCSKQYFLTKKVIYKIGCESQKQIPNDVYKVNGSEKLLTRASCYSRKFRTTDDITFSVSWFQHVASIVLVGPIFAVFINSFTFLLTFIKIRYRTWRNLHIFFRKVIRTFFFQKVVAAIQCRSQTGRDWMILKRNF